MEEPREVSPRVPDALSEPHGDRISTDSDPDDRDAVRSGFHGSGGRDPSRDDDTHLELDQFLHRPSKVRLALGRSRLEKEILSLAIAELGQGVPERQEP